MKTGFHRAAGQFDVLEQLEKPVSVENQVKTSHYKYDRGNRANIISEGTGDPLYSFIVDTGHPNGNEIHTITEKAEIIIQNERTKRIVTVLFARPAQVTRYWKNLGTSLPNDEAFKLVKKFASMNVERNLNNA
jgi:hypothetical protein